MQQTPDTIAIKVEEDIGEGMPAVEDGNGIGDRSTTTERLCVDPPPTCPVTHSNTTHPTNTHYTMSNGGNIMPTNQRTTQ